MKKGNLTGGSILILLGVWFLAVQLIPQLNAWAQGQWALIIIGIGVAFLLASILNNIAGLSIPAFIIGGIGGLLYYQNVTGDWASWAYAWTFIPGFVGFGLLFYSIQARDKDTRSAGFILLFISVVLFFVFGSFLGADKDITQYWPVVLILLGIKSIFKNKKKQITEKEETVESKQVIVEVKVEEETKGEENEN
ncbi:MAG: hypothetical protein HN392_09575 [Anaerolineae bacterium]|jgi:hypothetical protein|nr:hypothetical protein [Anaerolineae bacterium]MBT7074552.1 hypothetical protein [Anaerolineae bacterium]MBT7782711.1 hypothetical protein [Anaerolineae bacterium]